MKICTKCEVPKDDGEFAFKNKKTGRLNAWCKVCQKQYKDEHYDHNRESYIRKAHKHRGEYRGRLYVRLEDYYRQHPCVDCGENDFVVCQSDHVRGRKIASVSTLIHRGFSWENLALELLKCDTRCANCHMRKTAKELGWYKDMGYPSIGLDLRLSSE